MKSELGPICLKPPKSDLKPRQTFQFFRAALSKFLKRTQKIVKSVEPTVRIVLPTKRKYKKKGGKQCSSRSDTDIAPKCRPLAGAVQLKAANHIVVPLFTGKLLFQIEVSSAAISEGSCSEEGTDDESYAHFHDPKERIEEIYFKKIDVFKAKRSANRTPSLEAGLEMLRRFMPPSTAAEYEREGVDLLPWPCNKLN